MTNQSNHQVVDFYPTVIDIYTTVTDLYTTADVKQVREQLYKEQQGRCAMTKQAVLLKDCHLDHRHDSKQYVRATLYKQSNMALGKIENLWTRYLAYWYKGDLKQFLRQTADYLEATESQPPRWRHTGWQNKLKTLYNSLKEQDKEKVLCLLNERSKALYEPSSNGKERKEKFSRLVLDRSLGFDVILRCINEVKNKTS